MGMKKQSMKPKKRFSAHISNQQIISADLRFLIYKTVVANGGLTEFNDMLNIYRTADLHEEKLRALRALGYSNSSDLITKALEFGLSGEVRSQDLFYTIASCGSSSMGREMTWRFVRERWNDIFKLIGNSGMLMDRTIEYATKDFSDPEKAKEVENFFKDHPVPSAERTIKQSIESINSHAKWLQNNKESVAKWLDEHV